jgi:hypothetical protein
VNGMLDLIAVNQTNNIRVEDLEHPQTATRAK